MPSRTRLALLLGLLGCAASAPPPPSPSPELATELASVSSDDGGWAPARDDPAWKPAHEVVCETPEGELEVLGRVIPPPGELPAGRWGIRARYLTPALVAEIRSSAVPGLWLTRATDEDLAHVAALGSLTSLSVVGEEISDRGLVHLRGLARLETLESTVPV